MVNQDKHINTSYENFYAARAGIKVYPTEFVVRTFMANYPGLTFAKPLPSSRVLDVAFGDGRNTTFLCDQGLEVSGIEITQGIVDQTLERLKKLGQTADLQVGRNSKIPFEKNYFDYILASHCCYYCDEEDKLSDNLKEYARVMKKDAWLVASVASRNSYIFKNAVEQPDGSWRINADPYNNRNGYRLHAFAEKSEIEAYFSPFFHHFSFGFADNDYYGVQERVFWVVCQKK